MESVNRKYLNKNISVGDVYKNDFGLVVVELKINDDNFQCMYVNNNDKKFIVNSLGRFGYCWNNPITLCSL